MSMEGARTDGKTDGRQTEDRYDSNDFNDVKGDGRKDIIDDIFDD
jgi:hypothetical protein